MAIIRCEKGHAFNDRRHGKICPTCGLEVIEANDQYLGTSRTAEEIVEALLYTREEPVVGWIVCIEGARQGKSYKLHDGKNFVGRADDMDIQVLGDPAISRKNHAILVYDPKKAETILLPGDSQGLVYLDGDNILEPTVIEAYSDIELGNSKFLFIPFCGEHFQWNIDVGE